MGVSRAIRKVFWWKGLDNKCNKANKLFTFAVLNNSVVTFEQCSFHMSMETKFPTLPWDVQHFNLIICIWFYQHCMFNSGRTFVNVKHFDKVENNLKLSMKLSTYLSIILSLRFKKTFSMAVICRSITPSWKECHYWASHESSTCQLYILCKQSVTLSARNCTFEIGAWSFSQSPWPS